MKITMTPFSKRQRARFIYTKDKKNATRLYIYSKSKALFKKQDNFCHTFIHKKPDTVCYAIFREILEIGIYIYTKSMTLCVP